MITRSVIALASTVIPYHPKSVGIAAIQHHVTIVLRFINTLFPSDADLAGSSSGVVVPGFFEWWRVLAIL